MSGGRRRSSSTTTTFTSRTSSSCQSHATLASRAALSPQALLPFRMQRMLTVYAHFTTMLWWASPTLVQIQVTKMMVPPFCLHQQGARSQLCHQQALAVVQSPLSLQPWSTRRKEMPAPGPWWSAVYSRTHLPNSSSSHQLRGSCSGHAASGDLTSKPHRSVLVVRSMRPAGACCR